MSGPAENKKSWSVLSAHRRRSSMPTKKCGISFRVTRFDINFGARNERGPFFGRHIRWSYRFQLLPGFCLERRSAPRYGTSEGSYSRKRSCYGGAGPPLVLWRHVLRPCFLNGRDPQIATRGMGGFTHTQFLW